MRGMTTALRALIEGHPHPRKTARPRCPRAVPGMAPTIGDRLAAVRYLMKIASAVKTTPSTAIPSKLKGMQWCRCGAPVPGR